MSRSHPPLHTLSQGPCVARGGKTRERTRMEPERMNLVGSQPLVNVMDAEISEAEISEVVKSFLLS